MTHIIAIGGPSCAGKTELSQHVASELSAPILPIDAYYVNLNQLTVRERSHFNFDEPTALDHYLLRHHIEALAAGQTIERPTYDFTAHTRAAGTVIVAPKNFVILEGLFALYWDDIRPFLGTKVFVDAPDEVCLYRRSIRDVRDRGRTPESVLEQYEKTVRPMAQLYVRPTARWADVVVSGEQPFGAVDGGCVALRTSERNHRHGTKPQLNGSFVRRTFAKGDIAPENGMCSAARLVHSSSL